MLEFKKTNRNFLLLIFFVFQVVGLIGILWISRQQFSSLTPLNLLLTFILLVTTQENFSGRELLFLIFVSVFGFFIEYFGVHYKILFGHYFYGDSLGVKFFGVPLIMAINWVLVIYLACTISDTFPFKPLWKVILGAMLPVSLDILMEPIAPILDYWSWQNDRAPLKNFIAWYLISLFFIFFYFLFKLKLKNKNSLIIFFTYMYFFILLNILLER